VTTSRYVPVTSRFLKFNRQPFPVSPDEAFYRSGFSGFSFVSSLFDVAKFICRVSSFPIPNEAT